MLVATEYEQYLQAHNAYAQKEYDTAISLLNQLPPNNFPVLYNLGWSYLKNNEPYLAVRSFKRALSFCSGKNRIQTNILCKKIQTELGVQVAASRLYEWYYVINAYLPTIGIQLIFLLLFLMLCYMVLVPYFCAKKWLFYTILLCFCMSTILVYDRFVSESQLTILIKNKNRSLYSGPDYWYAPLCQLKQGSDGHVISLDGDWYCVSCNGRVGWLNAADMDIVS